MRHGVNNPIKVLSSLSEHLDRSCLEKGVGGESHRWWRALCILTNKLKNRFIFKTKTMKMKKILSIVFLFSLVVNFTSVVPTVNAMQIPEGAIIKTEYNPDVYIVKYKNGKQFKRLVLNPQVFESYGHLRWEDILIVDQSAMNSFITSDLVRADGQAKVYQLIANGDIGSKHYLDYNSFDLDSVYTINDVDFNNYITGEIKGIQTEQENNVNTVNQKDNIESVDSKLQEVISANKGLIESNTEKIRKNDEFIVKIKNEMSEYFGYSLVQQSGQQLINEIKNESYILKELVNICNKLTNELITLLGSGEISSSKTLYLMEQFTFYSNQQDLSYNKINSLMDSYVSNTVLALNQKANEKSEELARMTKVAEIAVRLNSLIEEADVWLDELDNRIEAKRNEIEIEKNRNASMEFINERIAPMIVELNYFVDQYNDVLVTRNKLSAVAVNVINYGKYGTPLSYVDKLFLQDLGINL